MMSTETLKIILVQRILSIADDSILKQIDCLLNNENIIGYDAAGNPVKELDYKAELDRINDEIDKGTALLLSSEEVRKRIIDENTLA